MPNDDDIEITLNRAAIKALADSDGLRDGLEILGQVAETSAKQHAPVDTGNLRRSITHEVGRDLKGLYMRYGTNVEYGIYQELGTRFHPPHPYLRPALQAIRNALRGQ